MVAVTMRIPIRREIVEKLVAAFLALVTLLQSHHWLVWPLQVAEEQDRQTDRPKIRSGGSSGNSSPSPPPYDSPGASSEVRIDSVQLPPERPPRIEASGDEPSTATVPNHAYLQVLSRDFAFDVMVKGGSCLQGLIGSEKDPLPG